MTTTPDPAHQPQPEGQAQPTTPLQGEHVQQPSDVMPQAPAQPPVVPQHVQAATPQAPAQVPAPQPPQSYVPQSQPTQQTEPTQQTQPTVPLPDTAPHFGAPVPPAPATQPASQGQSFGVQQPYGGVAATASVGAHTGAGPQVGLGPQTGEADGASRTPEKKSRAGVLFAGIAIGAIVGGIVGGGASALIVENQTPAAVVAPQTNGRVTLNNLETATSVSGVAAAAIPSVVTLEVSGSNAAGSGSGVIYNKDGYIVTNAHVVTLDGEAGANPSIRVWLSDGRILDGKLIGTDPYADLAVVKIDAENLEPITLADSADINVGDLAVAIGAPLNLANTVTSGVVSALNRGISVGSPIVPGTPEQQPDSPDSDGQLPWFRFGDPNAGDGQQEQQQTQATATQVTLPVVQTDASINPGNSGGALLNANAELIGINVAIASNGADSSTAGSDGLGFAIPVNLVERVADALIAGETPSHGLLGISATDSSNDTDDDRNFAGGLISQLVSGGPAEKAGLKVGDVITAIDGVPADSGTTVSALVRMHEAGDQVTVSYVRGGKPGEASVTLGEMQQ